MRAAGVGAGESCRPAGAHPRRGLGVGGRQKVVRTPAMKCLQPTCGKLLRGHPGAHQPSRQLLWDATREGFGQGRERVMSSERPSAEEALGFRCRIVQPESSTLPATEQSRLGRGGAGTSGGRHAWP